MNKRNTRLLKIAFLCLFCSAGMYSPAAVRAEDASPVRLSPRQAEQLALGNTLGVWTAMKKLEQADTIYRWRYLRLLPELEVKGALTSNQIDATVWQSSLDGSASFILQAEDLLYPKETSISRSMAETSLSREMADFRAEIYTSYYELVLLQKEIILFERQVQSAADRLEAARFDFDNGRISEYEYLSARLSYEEAVPELKEKQIDYESAVQQFRLLIGLEDGRPLILTGDLPDNISFPDTREKIISDLSDAPLIRQQTEQVREKGNDLKKLPLRFLPDLSLILSRSYSTVIPDGTSSDSDRTSYSIGLTFNFNDLLPGSQYRSAREAARLDLEEARRLLEDTLAEKEVSLQEIWSRFEKSGTDIEAAGFKKELADRFYTIALSEYENGRQDILELEEADLKRGEAQLSLLSAIYQQLSLVIELERLTGKQLIAW